jgi:tRNA-binding EMAP/Myf-like protein
VNESLSIEELKSYIPEHLLLVNKEIVEVYRDKKRFGDKKSVLIRFDLQKMDGNLTSDEVIEVGKLIETNLKKVNGLEIRGEGVTGSLKIASAMPQSDIAKIEEDSVTGELPSVLPKIANEFIVVGKILSIEKHPNADRLVICRVDVGSSKPAGTLFEDSLQIVTGAPNISALVQQFNSATDNLTAPVALPGAVVKSHKTGGSIQIKISELRGVVSEGMLCSSDELELPNPGYDGILVLGEDYSKRIGEIFKKL